MPYLVSGLGQTTPTNLLEQIVSAPLKSVTSKVVEFAAPVAESVIERQVMPKVQELVKSEVIPKITLALFGVGILAAIIGSWFATRRRKA